MQVSKWLRIQVLLNEEEMESLFSALGNFGIYLTGTITKTSAGSLERQEFVDAYRRYVHTLKEGNLPDDSHYRTPFSSALSTATDHFFVIPVNEEEQLLRVCKPVVQLQLHRMGYSLYDGKFRPMIFGRECIDWGLQFSYPQLYRDPDTHQVEKVEAGDKFPNTELFHTFRRWCRQHSVPTPFVVNGERVNTPMRLGKQCFSWINRHPKLAERGISVRAANGD
ncbi:MAG: hypothetical protein WB791_05895 [Waddliaceae bacterium]